MLIVLQGGHTCVTDDPRQEQELLTKGERVISADQKAYAMRLIEDAYKQLGTTANYLFYRNAGDEKSIALGEQVTPDQMVAGENYVAFMPMAGG